jgi:preprotein translocase subunit SecD
MNRYAWWQYALIILLIVLGVLYALPNLYGSNPAIQISMKNSAAMPANFSSLIAKDLKKEKLTVIDVKQDPDSVLIRFNEINDQLKALDYLKAVLNVNQYSISPNIAASTPAWLKAIGAKQMTKGLDLQGGIHFLEQVETDVLVKKHVTDDSHAIASSLREDKIRYTGIKPVKGNAILITFMNDSAYSNGKDYLESQFNTYTWEKVYNHSSMPQIKGTLTDAAYANLVSSAVKQNMAILRTRVNELGVSEPVVVQQGVDKISVDLPGIQDASRAKELIGKVATITMYMNDEDHDPYTVKKSGDTPIGTTLYSDNQGQPVLLKNQVMLNGSSITSATAQTGQDGFPEVAVGVGGSAQSMFNRLTAQNIGKRMATVLTQTQLQRKMVNGKPKVTTKQVSKVINNATINSALGNSFVITHLDSQQYAENLALLLRSGAYSAPLIPVQERLVGPSMGKENIYRGKLSTIVGTLLVILFMMFYYRFFGVVASSALIMNLVFIIAILSFIGATLTLPGIAAIVLTLGMAVDANVLINERIREELRLGVTPQAAIKAGYGRAFMTIVDANVTTLIVAVVLVTISSSSVKGFAVNLIIGLLTSMITAIFFTRALINLTYGRRKKIKKLSIGI